MSLFLSLSLCSLDAGMRGRTPHLGVTALFLFFFFFLTSLLRNLSHV